MYESTIYKQLKKTMDALENENEIKAILAQVGQVITTNVKDQTIYDSNNSQMNLMNVFSTTE